MREELKEVIKLQKEGKIQRRLIVRLVALAIITVFAGALLIYDLFWQNLELLETVIFASLGFCVAFFFFVKFNKFVWDEEREIVSVGRFDLTSFVVLLIFIAYRLSINKFLEISFEDAVEVSGLSLAVLFGGMLGRLFGTLLAVHRTHKERK